MTTATFSPRAKKLSVAIRRCAYAYRSSRGNAPNLEIYDCISNPLVWIHTRKICPCIERKLINISRKSNGPVKLSIGKTGWGPAWRFGIAQTRTPETPDSFSPPLNLIITSYMHAAMARSSHSRKSPRVAHPCERLEPRCCSRMLLNDLTKQNK